VTTVTAAAPPSAATVCERIGTTFDTSATRRPGCSSQAAMAARSPAPPPPTTMTSVLTTWIGGALVTP